MKNVKTGENMAKKFFKSNYDGKKLEELISNFLNSFTFDKKGFLEEVEQNKNKNEILEVSLLWLLKLKYFKDKKQYDLKNKASVEAGNKIIKLLNKEICNISRVINYNGTIDYRSYESGFHYNSRSNSTKPVKKEIMFVETMGREHRTLQQNFSKLVFGALLVFPKTKKKLGVLNKDFHKLPLI